VEHALHVQVEHAVPRGVRELGQRSPPVGPRVVDQDVERTLTLGDDLGQPLAFVVLAQVGRDGDALADLGQLGGDRVADVRFPR